VRWQWFGVVLSVLPEALSRRDGRVLRTTCRAVSRLRPRRNLDRRRGTGPPLLHVVQEFRSVVVAQISADDHQHARHDEQHREDDECGGDQRYSMGRHGSPVGITRSEAQSRW